MNRIRVILVDDQNLFVESLKSYLVTYADDIDVVGIARDGNEAIDLTDKLQPHIVLMDIYMPNLNGVDATKSIHARYPEVKIAILSTFGEDKNIKEALSAGASGYLLKDIAPTELIASIRALNEGAIQLSPAAAVKLVDQMYSEEAIEERFSKRFECFGILSSREKQVFALVARGFDNQQIADKIFVAEQTVRNYVSSIYSKLEIKDRFQIIQIANKSATK
jgi:DNA-binding NarL/FixJ family response regulator